MTNDLGDYRVAHLLPGRYDLVVEPKPLRVQKVVRDLSARFDEPVLGDGRTYYINASSIDGASLLTLSAGEIREGLDVVLLKYKTVCLRSAIADSPGARNVRIPVMLSEIAPSNQTAVAAGTLLFGDEFVICGIPPGA